ncbi:Estrogen receptor beta-like protein [Aphelenchoides fujianensis]|nr:Estrogen receptor beta-like protein [Aphelenchoides fujianensis]
MDKKEQPCAVCRSPARCIGFSAYVCKSCTVFYRRTYKQLDSLKCRRVNQCAIDHELRNTCRSCRLRKCREVGLRMAGRNLVIQYEGYPVDDTDEPLESSGPEAPDRRPASTSSSLDEGNMPSLIPESSTSSTELPNSSSVWGLPELSSQQVDAFAKYPHLHHVLLAFRHLEQRQRFLSAMHQEKDLLHGNETTALTKSMHTLLENATLRLACIFIADVLSKCELNAEQRMTILKHVPVEVSMAHKIGLTARVFPQVGDPRICMFVGLDVDHKNLQPFVTNQQEADLIRPMFLAGFQASEKARRLQLTLLECAMLPAIVIFEACDRYSINGEAVMSFRKHLYEEFMACLIEEHKSARAAGYRLIRLTSLIYDTKTLSVTQEEMYTVLDVFLPEHRNSFWQIKQQVPQSTKLETLAFASNDFIAKISEFGFD